MNREYKGKNAFPYFEKIRPEELDVILITQYSLYRIILIIASTSIIVELYPTSSRTTTSNARYL